MLSTHARRLVAMMALAGLPAFGIATWTLVRADAMTSLSRSVLLVLLAGVWLLSLWLLHVFIERPLLTLANLLSALREGDYSFRAMTSRHDDALSDVARELNLLADALKGQRVGAREASGLLREVMAEIDVAVFAFDEHDILRLINRAGERLLGRDADDCVGTKAEVLQLADALTGDTPRVIDGLFGETTRWEVRRSMFRQDGRPLRLLVLTDVSRTLREEERATWQRLIRVIGHEINNSLAPIMSVSDSLGALLSRDPVPPDITTDLRRGLQIIGTRAAALSRFTEAYARIAKLPSARQTRVDIADVVRRVVAFLANDRIRVLGQHPADAWVDPDQIEQALINVLRNAIDAAADTDGRVTLTWFTSERTITILVDDEGMGVGRSANLFVPFFTTKPGGSGIGLVLSRRIAEQNGGSLVLEDRMDARGARATLRLPAAGSGEGRPRAPGV